MPGLAFRRRLGPSAAAALALTLAAASAGAAASEVKLDGYLEYRDGGLLVVDGQWLRPHPRVKFKGKEAARSVAAIPLGYEVKAKGTRGPDGVLVASEIEAKPNGSALFESEIRQFTDAAEAEYRRVGRFYEENDDGSVDNVGRLHDAGPAVERVRYVMNALLPPYLAPEDVRVYVIDNPEWNAFAMGNYSIYVFSGLLDGMDDDEVAIVLGHELTHATHEHTRRHFKKEMWIQLAALGVSAAAESIDDDTARGLTQLLAAFGAMAWSSGYGRDLEDQADRVGLRYAYDAGFDVSKGPRLWERFATKYGEPGKVANFFFSDHSLASARARNLERQLAANYAGGPKTGDTRAARAKRAVEHALARAEPEPGSHAGAEAAAEGAAALAPSGSHARVEEGMSPAEVRRRLGEPDEEIVFGAQTKWIYPDLTVVFRDGRVAEVRF